MNCLFCQQELHFDGYNYGERWLFKYACNSINCMVDRDFPRYLCSLDPDNNISSREYALGKFYVKVRQDYSLIYQLKSCMLMDEVWIPRALWLNSRNLERTLDTLRLCVTFS